MEAPSVTPFLSSAGDPDALRAQIENPNLSEDRKIAIASEQFESVLLNLFLKDAMKPLLHQLGGSQASADVYRHYMTTVLSDSIAQSGGFGFSSIIQHQLNAKSQPEDLSRHEG